MPTSPKRYNFETPSTRITTSLINYNPLFCSKIPSLAMSTFLRMTECLLFSTEIQRITISANFDSSQCHWLGRGFDRALRRGSPFFSLPDEHFFHGQRFTFHGAQIIAQLPHAVSELAGDAVFYLVDFLQDGVVVWVFHSSSGVQI